MKKEILLKWADELESGKYQQTKGCLHNKDGFCCLGVLCEMAVKDGICKKELSSNESEEYIYDGDNGVPPPSVLKWLDINIVDAGSFLWGNRDHSLAKLNDYSNYTFKDIAKLLREKAETCH